jgi:hypothetical protein
LFAGDFDRYFAEASQGTALWLFVHVPKTAGSSMEVEMAGIMKPFANIEIDYTDTTKPYHLLFDEAVQRFIARHHETPYRSATGHVVARHTEMIRQAIPGVRCFSMLRNPIARIISDYRYQCSQMNLARDQFIKTTPDFATYIARKYVHNKTATALVPKPIVEARDDEAAINFVMENFAFIGLQEMYPVALRTVTTLMGTPRTPEARIRVNTETENKVELTPQEEADLKQLNSVDMALFNAFTKRWRGIREDLRTYLSTHGRPAAA